MASREESLRGSREITQIKAMIGFVVSIPCLNWKGKNALHGLVEFVLRVADSLATKIVLRCWVISAQIVNLHNDGVPERALIARIQHVGGWRYLEATSASVTKTMVGTECKLVDSSRKPGSEIYAACCKRMSRSAYVPKISIMRTGSCTVMSRCEGRTAARVLHPAIGITT
jgi:hypothetical protein